MNSDLTRAIENLNNLVIKIIKIDLGNRKFDVLQSNDDVFIENSISEKSYASNMTSLGNNTVIHPDDRNSITEHLNFDFFSTYFEFEDEYVLRYRRLINGVYRWVMMRVIKSQNYCEKNRELFLYVLVLNDKINLENENSENLELKIRLNDELEKRKSIINSLADIYISMHLIDLTSNVTYNIKTDDTIQRYVDVYEDTFKKMEYTMENVCAPEHFDGIREFADFSTLEKRLENKKVISYDFIGIHFGWCRAQFIPIKYEGNKLVEVLFTTQVIDDDKKEEERLRKLSYTDGLTHLYNRTAFIEDVKDYQITNDTVLYAFDLNGLKYINDNFGHLAGDDVISSFAAFLLGAFNSQGKCYRMGGDEFVVLAETKNPNEPLELLVELVTRFNKNKRYVLSSSVGYSLRGKSIDSMMKNADINMYKDKALYYKDKQR